MMQDQSPWDNCPPGAVSAMADRLRRQRRRANLRPIIAIGALVLMLSAVSYSLTKSPESGSSAGLTCGETVPLLASYHDNSLDASASNEVRDHLSHCPMCRKHYEEKYPSEVRVSSPESHGLLAFAHQIGH